MNRPAPVAWVFEESATLYLQLERLLQELGYAVQPGQSTRTADSPALIGVALLGTSHNGFKLLRQLATQHACPTLLFTASGRRSDFGWGLRAGATAVLAWPPTREQLLPWAQSAC